VTVRILSAFEFFQGLKKLLFSVAGKKGKVMERRIMKDFQIGFVEDVLGKQLAAATAASGGTKDVFGSLAMVLGKRSQKK
jgi:transient receptor potential cation channel subfamily C member 4